MFGTRISLGKKIKDEAEKPFWISFADLMTALMVMFLLVMSVALLLIVRSFFLVVRRFNNTTYSVFLVLL